MSGNEKKNASTFFAVLNMRKIKTMAGCINVAAHNLRQRLNNDSKEAIDPNLSRYNVYDGVQNYVEFKKKYEEIVEKAHLKRKIQKNASRILEFVFSFSHEYSNGWQTKPELKGKFDNYFRDCKGFITQKYGEVIINSAIHYDETTPHIHVMCIPLLLSDDGKEAKYSSSEFVGGIKGLKELHTNFNDKVGKKYGLARGVEGSRATHNDIRHYKAQEEKKFLEIEDLKNKLQLELANIEKEKIDTERVKREAEFVKSRIQNIQNDMLKRDAELSKKEQEYLAIEKDIPAQIPEIPLPPVQFTADSRKSWRDNIQKMVEGPFKIIVKAYHSIHLKYNKLMENFTKLVAMNENLKNRAEKAEKDLSDKPINEIIKERETRKSDTRDRSKLVKQVGVSL
jgi:hypothetical protein